MIEYIYTADIIPVYKKCLKTSPFVYRFIVRTSIVTKLKLIVMEKLSNIQDVALCNFRIAYAKRFQKMDDETVPNKVRNYKISGK